MLSVWDILQTDLNCCGVSFPGDWAMTAWGRNRRQQQASSGSSPNSGSGAFLPESCCARLAYGETCRVDSEFSRMEGCLEALEQSAKTNASTLGAVACATGLGQITLIVAAVHLIKKVEQPKSIAPFF